jgi:hypothetical protein
MIPRTRPATQKRNNHRMNWIELGLVLWVVFLTFAGAFRGRFMRALAWVVTITFLLVAFERITLAEDVPPK